VNTGTNYTNFSVLRFDSDGSPDDTFGGDGVVQTDFDGGENEGNGLLLTPDGGLVVAGSTLTTDQGANFALARYNPGGALVRGFGTGGKVTTDFDGVSDRAYSVALAGDGGLIVAGEAGNDVCNARGCVSVDFKDFGLASYDPDGSLDTSFGTGGKVTTDFDGGEDRAFDVKIGSNGKIVAAGDVYDEAGPDFSDFGLARYTPRGRLDTSFGTDGKVQTSFFEPSGGTVTGDEARGLAIQPDGKIVAAGYTISFTQATSDYEQDFAIARYDGASAGGDPTPPPKPKPKPKPDACTKVGTRGNDVLRGTPGRDVVCGLGGNDVVYGFGGDDILRGGPGNDALLGGPGNDRLYGDSGDDALSGGPGNDVLRGGSGKDRLAGGPGRDSVRQ
jgi:uncharacterized delta-60 repeat protein